MSSDPLAAVEDVVACYRTFLGRDPESPEVIASHLDARLSKWELVRRVYDSAEAARLRINAACGQMDVQQDTRGVEVVTNAASAGRLIEHIEEVWSRYGREEAYFSVLVNPKYLSDRLSRQDVEEFYGTGELEVDHLGGGSAT